MVRKRVGGRWEGKSLRLRPGLLHPQQCLQVLPEDHLFLPPYKAFEA
jgi:hypothetical protein